MKGNESLQLSRYAYFKSELIIFKGLDSVRRSFTDFMNQIALANSRLRTATEQLDPVADLREFVLSTYNGNTAPHRRVQPDEKVSFSAHLVFIFL